MNLSSTLLKLERSDCGILSILVERKFSFICEICQHAPGPEHVTESSVDLAIYHHVLLLKPTEKFSL